MLNKVQVGTNVHACDITYHGRCNLYTPDLQSLCKCYCCALV